MRDKQLFGKLMVWVEVSPCGSPPSLQPAAVRAGPPVGVSPCTRTLLSPGGGGFSLVQLL